MLPQINILPALIGYAIGQDEANHKRHSERRTGMPYFITLITVADEGIFRVKWGRIGQVVINISTITRYCTIEATTMDHGAITRLETDGGILYAAGSQEDIARQIKDAMERA
jgi:hypothetical protein